MSSHRRYHLALLLIAILVSALSIAPAAPASWVEEPVDQREVYLPIVAHCFGGRITFIAAWAADLYGRPQSAFIPGDTIRLYAGGLNTRCETTDARLVWTVQGPCGATTLFSGILGLEKDIWTKFQTTAASSCLGIYTSTVTVTHNNTTTTLSAPFVVNNPSGVTTSTAPAFDKCNIPTVAQMQTWWNHSPYWTTNLYIGGVHRACSNSGLDAFWITEVSRQGWYFIPTWVGPQAPCSGYKYKISYDPTQAYWEGRSEAGAAYSAAYRLGLGQDTIIYYDLEGFSPASTECRAAVKSFMNGWVQRLHELGAKAGAYGSPSRSYMSDWAEITHIPDDVWIALWYTGFYDEYASVFVPKYLPDSLWYGRRIRQYTWDHKETWGGLTMTIDSNVVYGEVVYVPTGSSAASSALLEPIDGAPTPDAVSTILEPADPMPAPPAVSDFQLISPEEGWALANGRLLWTDDGGQNWQDITPQPTEGQILAAYFLQENRGWLVILSEATGQIDVLYRQPGSDLWQASTLPALPGEDFPFTSVHPFFLDAQTGWMAVELQSNSNFSHGALFRTVDGGASWEQMSLPVGEAVRFIDSSRGWTAGGAAGDELYITRDGGRSWEPVQAISFDEDASPEESFQFESYSLGSLPDSAVKVEVAKGRVWAQTINGTCSGYKTRPGESLPESALPFQCETRSHLLSSMDGGLTWIDITPK